MTRTHMPRPAARFVALVALALALFAGSGIAATPASARVIGPAGDTFTAGCLSLQNRVDALVAEYGRLYNDPGSTQAQLEAVLAELRSVGTTWIQIGCRDVFGSIASRIESLPPPYRLHAAVNVSVLSASEPPLAQPFAVATVAAQPVAQR